MPRDTRQLLLHHLALVTRFSRAFSSCLSSYLSRSAVTPACFFSKLPPTLLTHRKDSSALRTFLVQPTGQVMPETATVTRMVLTAWSALAFATKAPGAPAGG